MLFAHNHGLNTGKQMNNYFYTLILSDPDSTLQTKHGRQPKAQLRPECDHHQTQYHRQEEG